MNFEWHVRTRIESELLDQNLCNTLYKSGLKHILLGLESASERILKLMNKKDKLDDYLELAELIVHQFNQEGISVRFPSIIGFPTETEKEINYTIEFLKYMHDILAFGLRKKQIPTDICSLINNKNMNPKVSIYIL